MMISRKSVWVCVVVLALAFGVTPGFAATVTVGPAGPPTYNFALISEAVTAAGNGDTIDIAAGNYDDWVGIIGRSNLTLQGPASGTPAVVKISASNVVNQGIYIAGQSTNIILRNLSVDMSANNGIEYRACISVYEGAAATLDHLDLYGAGRIVDVFNGGRPTITNCNLHDATPRDFGNGDASSGVEVQGVTSTFGYANATIHNCSFSSIGHPIRILANETGTPSLAQNYMGNLTVQHCTFNHFGGEYGIALRFDSPNWAPDSTVLFEDCTFTDWTGHGIFTNAYPDTNTGPSNFIVRRCEMINDLTAYRAGTGLFLGYNSNILLENVAIAAFANEAVYIHEPCGNITMHQCSINNVNDSVMAQRLTIHNPTATIRNSILRTPNGFSWEVSPTYGSATSISYDVDYSIFNSANAKDFSSDVHTVTRGAHYTYNTSQVNYPMFVDPEATGDLHLQDGSPAINAGMNLGIAIDVEGKPRDATPDIGAYQQSGVDSSVNNWSLY